jgi:hypothetical protein
MATLPITVAIGGEAGALYRRLAKAIEQAAGDLPDNNASGASTTLTIDNAPAGGRVSVQVTAGPITSALIKI